MQIGFLFQTVLISGLILSISACSGGGGSGGGPGGGSAAPGGGSAAPGGGSAAPGGTSNTAPSDVNNSESNDSSQDSDQVDDSEKADEITDEKKSEISLVSGDSDQGKLLKDSDNVEKQIVWVPKDEIEEKVLAGWKVDEEGHLVGTATRNVNTLKPNSAETSILGSSISVEKILDRDSVNLEIPKTIQATIFILPENIKNNINVKANHGQRIFVRINQSIDCVWTLTRAWPKLTTGSKISYEFQKCVKDGKRNTSSSKHFDGGDEYTPDRDDEKNLVFKSVQYIEVEVNHGANPALTTGHFKFEVLN